jgi:membrane associated rhomboid family serine protease
VPDAARGLQIPLATIAMLAVVAIGFALGVTTGVVPVAPSPQQLVAAGASYGPRTLDDEPWRVLTAALVHAGWAHLIVNGLTMAVMGVALERRAGRLATVVVFVGASAVGTAAGTASAPYAVIAGASSGALGLAAALVIVMALRAVTAVRAETTTRGGPHLAELALLGIALTVIVAHVVMARGRDDIDQVGHVAGVMTGLVMGVMVAPRPAAAAATATATATATAAETETETETETGSGLAAIAALTALVAAAALLLTAGPAPYEPRRATAQLLAIEARFDELVDQSDDRTRDLSKRTALATSLIADVAAPLDSLFRDPRLHDTRMTAKLRARVSRLQAYARARAGVVRQFADAVNRDDVAPLADIERASRAADALLDGPLP